MKIIFFCPSPTTVNGGIKHIFRMAEALMAQGHDAVVFEQNHQRPSWFSSTAPIVGPDILNKNADHFYVLPEDQPHILRDFSAFPQPKIIYSQNHFYGALGIAEASSYADYGVTALLCSSRTIFDHCRLRHPTLRAFVVPCAVDPTLFKPAARKQKIITYMPRKRAIEAAYLRDMFRFAYPEHNNWQWREISNISEAEAATILGDAAVFLSLSRLEGFGLTPIEAMASGCVVAGFTGIGGREYATPQNGFWTSEDDHAACVAALAKAVTLYERQDADLQAYHETARLTVTTYTPETFAHGVKTTWDELLRTS